MLKKCDFSMCPHEAEFKGVIDPEVARDYVIARKMTVRAGMFQRHVQVCPAHDWMLYVSYSFPRRKVAEYGS